VLILIDIATSLNALFTDLKRAKDSPNNLMTQTLLMNVVQKEMPEWEHLITTSSDAVPVVKYSVCYSIIVLYSLIVKYSVCYSIIVL
jgi:hypothetical protein